MPDPRKSRAVLIGVSDYSRMHPLPAVANNVRDLAALLIDPEVWGLPRANCDVVLNPRSVDEVLDAVHRASTATSGTLLVYFAGHGLRGANGELRLVLPSGDQRNLYRTVGFDDIRDDLRAPDARAAGKVVILDCCYSGAADMGPADLIEEVAGRTAIDGTYVMTATTESRRALVRPGARYTVFTGALLDVIRSGVRNGPRFLTMETLFRQVADRIGSRGEPAPEQRSRGDGHRLAIVRNRWTPPPEPGADEPRRGAGRMRQWTAVAAAAVALLAVVTLIWRPWRVRDSPDSSVAPMQALVSQLDGSHSTAERRATVTAIGELARNDAASRPAGCAALQNFVVDLLPFPRVEPYNDPKLPPLDYRAPDVQDAVTELGGVPCPNLKMAEVDLRMAKLIGDFRSADLGWASLYRADVTKARFENATLTGIHLWQMNGKGVSFEGANFDGAEFSYTILAGANLRRATFRALVDRRTKFYYTDLRGADLRGAHLEGADLSIAKIDATTKFTGATADGQTLWPPKFDWRKAGVTT
ncbi:caspase, EACC1-associated type [Paractinoplanes atraurantiacus]|nr:pentapeptide repeat-containing protein [Actinoplanes atraurantiacus]